MSTVSARRVSIYESLFRRQAPIPTNPEASSNSEEGSGTVADPVVKVPSRLTPSKKLSVSVIAIVSVFIPTMKSLLGTVKEWSDPQFPSPSVAITFPFRRSSPLSSRVQLPDSAAVEIFPAVRGRNAASLELWKDEFWFAKEHRLFEGLPELYSAWKLCSERASHAHASSLLVRYYAIKPNTEPALYYSGVAPELLPLMFGGILSIMSSLECRIFEITESYLHADTELQQMLNKFGEDMETNLVSIMEQHLTPGVGVSQPPTL